MPTTVQALDQAAFLKDGLMDWLALFVDKCQQVGTRYDVYPALASLLLAFVQQDQAFLQDVAQGETVT
jgi:TorA-specific chaperone